MRKLLIAAATAVTTLLVSAGSAAAEVIPTPPCDSSAEYGPLGLGGVHQGFAPSPIPSAPHDVAMQPYREDSVSRFKYRLDISGSPDVPDAATATVAFKVTWDNRSDFDLYVYDGTGALLDSSVDTNWVTGNGIEKVTLFEIPQCTDFKVDVVNYLGLPNSVTALDVTVSNLAPLPEPVA